MIRINLLQERKAPAAGKTKIAGPSTPGAFQAYALLGGRWEPYRRRMQ